MICEVCGARFPEHWPKPIRCNHARPGADLTRRPKVVDVPGPAINAWSIIHTRLARFATSDEPWNPVEQKRWHDTEFLPLVPRDCSCHDHWGPIAASIDWSTAENAETSLYEAHNEVSSKYASNPTISIEQAREMWRGPRVAFIAVNYAAHGGTETFHQTLLPRLRHRRNIVGFGCIHGGGDPALLKVPFYEGREAITRLCSEVDVVVTWGVDCLTELLPEKRPKVIAVHHGDQNAGWIGETMWQKEVDEFVCVNQSAADHIRSTRNLPVHWIPNALDESRLQPTERLAEIKASIPSGMKVVLFGHRFSEEKRPGLAVEMAKHLPADWLLVMAGDGPLRPGSVPDNVRLVGRVDTLADWLQVSDVFVSMSTFEGFGLSMLEALACGVPLVATPVGIAPQFASKLLSVEAGAEDWAKAVVEVERNDQIAGFVRKLFSIEGHVEDWARVLSSAGVATPVMS